MAIRKFGVIGAGAWGTALANVVAANGKACVLWAREEEVVSAVNTDHQNPMFLPDVEINPHVRATSDLAEACNAEALLFVAPTQHLRAVADAAAPHIRDGLPVILCAKGIELESNALLSQVLHETVPHALPAVLSGPTFADEVARGLPTGVTLACADDAVGNDLAESLGSPTFRPYLSTDVVGAQIGGALKNVLAIAAGIVAGRSLGENAKAAVITRGLAEMLRFGEALGGNGITLMGLSGLGDLVLTCGSSKSRNHTLGLALARGEAAQDFLSARKSVAEGAYTAAATMAIAQEKKIDLPICEAVDAVINRGVGIDAAIEALLNRPFRAETG
jgi:glycerol-3-phosphate dehydrogenase (NAD(P)+)